MSNCVSIGSFELFDVSEIQHHINTVIFIIITVLLICYKESFKKIYGERACKP